MSQAARARRSNCQGWTLRAKAYEERFRQKRLHSIRNIPNQWGYQQSRENFAYIKLRGSYGWVSQDGLDRIVVGTAKATIIEKEPLLRWYFGLFQEVLSHQERNLVVIGYGFGDEHINQLIARSIKGSALRLFVISPRQPKDFKDLCTPSRPCAPHGQDIWEGLYGFYPGRVTDFYKDHEGGMLPPGDVFFGSLD